MTAKPSFAIIGAGIGGLALAALLSRRGAKVKVYEQAKQFQRIGAGIQMSPNADARPARARPGAAPAAARIRAAGMDQPRVGHRRVSCRS